MAGKRILNLWIDNNEPPLTNVVWIRPGWGIYYYDEGRWIPIFRNRFVLKLKGDTGINNFTYNNQTYDKETSIESYEDLLNAVITANYDSQRYTFDKWQLDNTDISTSNPLLYTFTESGELLATTTPKLYTITVNANNSSYGTVAGGGSYAYGSSRTITATPNTGYIFVKWTKNGNQVSTNASYTFTVTENATYTAVFEVEGPSDYYVGLYRNLTDFTSATDSNIISQAETGLYISATPKYPSASTFKMLTADNKLLFILIKQDISTNNIKVDVENPGVIGDLTNESFTSWFTKNTTRTLTIEGTVYDIYSRYRSSYGEDNGFRIKFN